MPHDRHHHHERMFHHGRAHLLDDPERLVWLPPGDVVARLELAPGAVVADVGAGTGYFALPIATAVAPGGRVFAVDLQPEMLERLRERLAPDAAVTLAQGDAARTTLEPASVDVAFLANVWHELDDPAAVLAEMQRIVRPGGRIAIVDWSPDAAEEPGPPREHRVANAAVAALLAKHGWRVTANALVGRYHYEIIAARP